MCGLKRQDHASKVWKTYTFTILAGLEWLPSWSLFSSHPERSNRCSEKTPMLATFLGKCRSLFSIHPSGVRPLLNHLEEMQHIRCLNYSNICKTDYPYGIKLDGVGHVDNRPSTAEAPPIDKIHPFSKIAVTPEPVMQLRCLSRSRISLKKCNIVSFSNQ